MALIEVHAELQDVAAALREIRDLLKMHYFPETPEKAFFRMSDMADYSRLTDEDVIERHNEHDRQILAYGETHGPEETTGDE